MLRRKMTGARLAKQLDVSAAWISYRLTGAQPIDLNDLQRIAEALQVGVIDLLPRAEREAGTNHWYPEAAGASRYAAWPKHPIIAASVPIPLPRPPGVRRTAPTGA